MKTLREHSNTNYSLQDNPTLEQINSGSLMRIADATEKMALHYTELIDRASRYERWYEQERKTTRRLEHSNAALRGHLKRAKGKSR